MRESPSVSVIMPTLNVERFLSEAIESVIGQTFEDWELLLVDDGSIDRSPHIAREYERRTSGRIRCLEHPGRRSLGASASRSLGIRHSRGVYVAFLDGDDVWLPEKLARDVAVLESHPHVMMLYGPARYWYSWTGDSADTGRDYVKPVGDFSNCVTAPPALIPVLVRDRLVPCTSTVVVRRDALNRLGGFDHSFRRVYTDQVLFARICLEAPVYVSAECWTNYRVHAGSSGRIAERTGTREASRLQFLIWLGRHLCRRGFSGTPLSSIVEDEAARSCDRLASQARHALVQGGLAAGLRSMGQLLRQRPRAFIRHTCPQIYFTLADATARARNWNRALRHRGRARTGRIIAHPNPIQIGGGSDLGETTLSWRARGTDAVEVRVGTREGPMLSRSGASGEARTGPWVHDRLTFYLQDASAGASTAEGSTLATVCVRTTANLLQCALAALVPRGK
jgi:glycosyltransferase involved in cell wall biosynthesis